MYFHKPKRRTEVSRQSRNSFICFRRVEDERFAALSAVLTVLVGSHENAGTALLTRALAAQSVDFAVFVNLEEKHGIVAKSKLLTLLYTRNDKSEKISSQIILNN